MAPPAKMPAVSRVPAPLKVIVPFDTIVQFGIVMYVDPDPVIWPELESATRHGWPPAAPVAAVVVVTSSEVPVAVMV